MNNHMQGSYIPVHRGMKQGLLKYLNMPLPFGKQLLSQDPKCLHTNPIFQAPPLGPPELPHNPTMKRFSLAKPVSLQYRVLYTFKYHLCLHE